MNGKIHDVYRGLVVRSAFLSRKDIRRLEITWLTDRISNRSHFTDGIFSPILPTFARSTVRIQTGTICCLHYASNQNVIKIFDVVQHASKSNFARLHWAITSHQDFSGTVAIAGNSTISFAQLISKIAGRLFKSPQATFVEGRAMLHVLQTWVW